MKKSVKYGLYFVVGLVAVFFFARIFFFFLFFSALFGEGEGFILMSGVDLFIYWFFRVAQRDTHWWGGGGKKKL